MKQPTLVSERTLRATLARLPAQSAMVATHVDVVEKPRRHAPTARPAGASAKPITAATNSHRAILMSYS